MIRENVDILEGQKERRDSQKQNGKAGRMAIAKSAYIKYFRLWKSFTQNISEQT